MTIENFDARFSAYIVEWSHKNAKRYRNADEMEAAMPDVYTRWLNTPADWLGGTTPGIFFAAYDDPRHLIAWMREYLAAAVPVPDPLLERIAELGEAAKEPLTELIRDAQGEIAMLGLSLLAEIDAEPPVADYIALIIKHTGEGELAIRATEALRAVGAPALGACLTAMQSAPVGVRLCLMDMLADFPGEDAALMHARALLREGADAALMAAYIARIGDPLALEDLYAVAGDPKIDYLTYLEVRNAIDALGGDPPAEREFAGDPGYESLHRLSQP